MAKQQKPKKTIVENIKNNYRQIEKSIVEQLYMKQDLHGTSIGSEREDIWRQLFDMILPKKFVMEHSVFIIDSKANVSREVDLAIIDETYTPYIFRYGKLKFIPIEAVAAVVECKSKSIKKNARSEWSASVKNLSTSTESIARLATKIAMDAVPTQKSTRPIRILCALTDQDLKEAAEEFDFVLFAINGQGDAAADSAHIEIRSNAAFNNLLEWYQSLNFHNMKSAEFNFNYNEETQKAKKYLEETDLTRYQIFDGACAENDGQSGREESCAKISLLSFNFQLNQLLMLINNPMLFPHRAYVDMFNGKWEEQENGR